MQQAARADEVKISKESGGFKECRSTHQRRTPAQLTSNGEEAALVVAEREALHATVLTDLHGRHTTLN
jgi:hypothetical protein